MRRALVFALILAVQCALTPAMGAVDDRATADQIEDFLRTAKIVKAVPIGKGVTRPWRLTLSDGTTTHDAAFQAVDRRREHVRFQNGRHERLFRDFYGYNVAAYRLARLLGHDDLVPVTIERSWKSKPGALSWWVPKKWDEDERLKAGVRPPDLPAWERQLYRARVFTALVEDTDRNLGNQLVTESFHLWLIDFTRAFRLSPTVAATGPLRRIDRVLFDRLRTLAPRDITRAVSPHVGVDEVRALIGRRDALVAHFTRIAAERGDAHVFFD